MTYKFLKSNGAAVEVWEWSHPTRAHKNVFMLGSKLIRVCERGPMGLVNYARGSNKVPNVQRDSSMRIIPYAESKLSIFTISHLSVAKSW